MYKENIYKQNKFFEDYEKKFIQNQQKKKKKINIIIDTRI